MLSIEDKIHKLLWNKRFVSIPPSISDNISAIIIRNPSLEELNYALFLREKTYNDCISNGVPTQEELIKSAQLNGYWSDEDAAFAIKADEEIRELETSFRTQKNLIKKKKIQKEIESIKNKKIDLKKKYDHLMTNSAEYLAREVYVFFLMQQLIYTLDNNRLWASDEQFNHFKNQDIKLINYLAEQFINGISFTSKEIREIARSVEWRLFWTLCRENLFQLFGQPISDLNLNQRFLIYWSRVYDNVYEDPDRPDNSVIENDEELDAWLLDKSNKDKADKVSHKTASDHQEQMIILDGYYSDTCTCGAIKIKSMGHGEKVPHESSCQWGVWIPYTQAEKAAMASQIYNRNSGAARQMITKEFNILDQKGLIQEQHLRDKKSRGILGAESKIHRINK